MVRGRSSSKKSKSNRERSKFKLGFRDLKKNQRAFWKELGHWKVDCSRIKDKNKESKTEANIARVTNTQLCSTSQTGGSNSNSSVFSFLITTRTISYSCDSEWTLDTRVIYHVCPNRDWFFSFKKLDGCSVVMSDDRPCTMKRIYTIHIKMFDEMMRELKDVRYVPQLKGILSWCLRSIRSWSIY